MSTPFSTAESFEEQTFTGLSLPGEDMSDKQFFGCRFEGCSFPESVWKRAMLEDCTFFQCDLTRANVAHLRLRGVRFEGCKLMGIDFSEVSTNPDMSFDECLLRYAAFTKLSLRRMKLVRCQAREASFEDCDLTDADFSESDLGGSTIRGCTLTHTELRTATGVFIDPARNQVKRTRIHQDAAVALAEHYGFVFEGSAKRR